MIVGNIFKNMKKSCYIARLKETFLSDEGADINYYYRPQYYEFNIQPASGSTDLMIYGDRVTKMYKTNISLNEYAGKFKEGDVAYLEGVIPKNETEKTYGIGANYKIVSVRPQNMSIIIYFEKR